MTREEQDQRHPDSLEGLTMTEALDQVQGPPLQVAFRGAPLNPMFTPAEVAGLRAEGYEVGPTQRMSDLPPLPDPLPEPEEDTPNASDIFDQIEAQMRATLLGQSLGSQANSRVAGPGQPDSLEGLTMTEALDQVQGPPIREPYIAVPLLRTPVAVMNGGDWVVCDDGTVWACRDTRGTIGADLEWYHISPPIPGTRAAMESGR